MIRKLAVRASIVVLVSLLLTVLFSCDFSKFSSNVENDNAIENIAKPYRVPGAAEAVSVYSNDFGQTVEVVDRPDLRSWLASHKNCRIDSLTAIADGYEDNPTRSFLVVYSKKVN